MSNNTLKYLFAVILPLIVGQLFVSCKHGNPVVSASLDRIEQVVQQHPDSALIELVRLDSLLDAGAVSIEGDRQMARYALLKTQTHDKNWIDDTYDSLILRAVRYYDDHGSEREQMLAHFYHGAIFRNARDYGAAFVAYRQAEQLAQKLDDNHYLSLIYGNLATASHDTYSKDAIMLFHKNLEYAQRSGNRREILFAMSDMAQCYSDRLVYDTAEILFRQVMDSLPASDPIVQNCLTSFIDQSITTKRFDLADSLLHLLFPVFKPIDLMNMACLFQKKGMSDSVVFYIQKAEQAIKTPEQKVFFYEKQSWIAEQKGDFASALALKRERIKEQNKVVIAILSKTVSDYQYNYERQQKNHAEYRNKQYRFYSAIIAAFFILLIIGGVAFTLMKRREHRLIIDAYMENVSVLQQTLLEQSDTIFGLKHHIGEIEKEYHNQIKELFSKSFNELDLLCATYYDNQKKTSEKDKIFELVLQLINDFADAQHQDELDRIINYYFDDSMEKAKSQEIGLNKEELQLFRYKVAGLSSRTIRLFMQIDSRDALQKRQQRLRRKLLHSDSPLGIGLASLLD